jgi:hypothetical protein
MACRAVRKMRLNRLPDVTGQSLRLPRVNFEKLFFDMAHRLKVCLHLCNLYSWHFTVLAENLTTLF